jgi:hypothetical protein
MLFEFDIEKAIAAVAFLMQREGGELDMFLSLKMLYLADREALVKWGMTITGDSFVSMPNGPVLSEVYDLFRGSARPKNQREWDGFFSEKVNHKIHLKKQPEIELLSEREMEVLEEARNQLNSMAPWDVSDWIHKACPEWQDPHGSSLPIEPESILKIAGKSETEIREIEFENRANKYARTVFGVR